MTTSRTPSIRAQSKLSYLGPENDERNEQMVTTWLAREVRWWRIAHLGGSPLVRWVDRAETLTQGVVLLLAITLVPIAITITQMTYTSNGVYVGSTVAIGLFLTIACAYTFIARAITKGANTIRDSSWESEWERADFATGQ